MALSRRRDSVHSQQALERTKTRTQKRRGSARLVAQGPHRSRSCADEGVPASWVASVSPRPAVCQSGQSFEPRRRPPCASCKPSAPGWRLHFLRSSKNQNRSGLCDSKENSNCKAGPALESNTIRGKTQYPMKQSKENCGRQ